MSDHASRYKGYKIPVNKLRQSMTECFMSALNFWQSGNYVAKMGGFHIAVGLWILGIEELGKYALLEEAATSVRDPEGTLEISVAVFKNHRIKSEKGQALLKKWGIDLGLAHIPLTDKTREALWYVAWDAETQDFNRDFRVLETGAFVKTEALQELMRLVSTRCRKSQQQLQSEKATEPE